MAKKILPALPTESEKSKAVAVDGLEVLKEKRLIVCGSCKKKAFVRLDYCNKIVTMYI